MDKAISVVGVGRGALPLDPPAGARFRRTELETLADVGDFVANP